MGITGGPFALGASLTIGGQRAALYSFDLTLNAFGLASSLDAFCTIYPYDGSRSVIAVTDWIANQRQALDATGLPLQWALDVACDAASSNTAKPTPHFLQLESGLVDELNDEYDANEFQLVGRTEVGRLLQDTRVAEPINKNVRGDQLISLYFQNFAATVPLTIVAPSPVVAGVSYDENVYTKAIRGRPAWDYISDIAATDGYVITCHNGKAAYGPSASGAPTSSLAWGADLTKCKVKSASARSRNIVVKVFGYDQRGEHRVIAQYPQSPALGAEVYPKHLLQEVDTARALSIAQSYYKQIVTKELVGELELYPDPPFLAMLAQYGANFLVQLDGVKPSSAALYHTKQVVLSGTRLDHADAELRVSMIIENHAPSSQAT